MDGVRRSGQSKQTQAEQSVVGNNNSEGVGGCGTSRGANLRYGDLFSLSTRLNFSFAFLLFLIPLHVWNRSFHLLTRLVLASWSIKEHELNPPNPVAQQARTGKCCVSGACFKPPTLHQTDIYRLIIAPRKHHGMPTIVTPLTSTSVASPTICRRVTS